MNSQSTSSPFDSSARDRVVQMRALHDEMSHELGLSPETMIHLYNQWEQPEQIWDDFRRWFDAVMDPLGVSQRLAFRVFTGQMSTLEFASQLTDEQLDLFDRDFERRQEDYMARLDEQERQIIARNVPSAYGDE